MAGIYIHIPFCRQKCYYCDFYKTTNSSRTESFLSALEKEAEQRKEYIKGESVKTIYFGGGTPSVLKEEELAGILSWLANKFKVDPDVEITFEANPDDLTINYLQILKRAGITRLSIGIQSFSNEHLEKMNRRHNAGQAVSAVENAFDAGFYNLSTDLIYGLPGLTNQQWRNDLKEMFRLPVVHLSAYHLTYHQGTPFYTWLKKGTLKELSENSSVSQFNILLDETTSAGFEQYEISNFARKQYYSEHNKAYWFGETYLGLGPSAHSFNGTSRRWNVAHIEAYINGLEKSKPFFEEEHLSESEIFNEYILTRIRTKWGISITEIRNRFGLQTAESVNKTAEKFVVSGKMSKNDNRYNFTREGLFVSDNLMTDFMII
jgi:oxygen-independent coproporphyrinogen III oxidase